MRALRRLQGRVEALFAEAEAAGLSAADVANLVSARGRPRRAAGGWRSSSSASSPTRRAAMPSISHANLEPRDRVAAATIHDLRAGAVAAADYDVVVSLAHRRGEVEALVGPGLPVVGLSVIPSEETRARLAAIDPMARVGMVSVFPEFVPIMKARRAALLRPTSPTSTSGSSTTPISMRLLRGGRRARLRQRRRGGAAAPPPRGRGHRVPPHSQPARGARDAPASRRGGAARGPWNTNTERRAVMGKTLSKDNAPVKRERDLKIAETNWNAG